MFQSESPHFYLPHHLTTWAGTAGQFWDSWTGLILVGANLEEVLQECACCALTVPRHYPQDPAVADVKKPPRHMLVIPQHQLSHSAEPVPPRCISWWCRRSCGWLFCLHVCSYQPDKYLCFACPSRLWVFGSLRWHSELEERLSLLGSLKNILCCVFPLMSWRVLRGK